LFGSTDGSNGEGDILIKYMFSSIEGRGREILIKNVFGSQGQGRNFKINFLFYP